jgi:hypothetical protein
MTLYLHSREEIDRLLAATGLTLLKEVRLLVTTGRGNDDIFYAFLTRLEGEEGG